MSEMFGFVVGCLVVVGTLVFIIAALIAAVQLAWWWALGFLVASILCGIFSAYMFGFIRT